MNELEKNDKERLISFIENNELDYSISESDIFKFSITAADKMKFFFYKTNEKYIVVKYDVSKDKEGNMMESAYEYYEFINMSQVLEQLSIYDGQIPKQYWNFCDGIDFKFLKENYDDNWANDFISENWILENGDNYKYLIYENSAYKPQLTSPYNTLHEVSDFNPNKSYTTVEKLYFEIHPESCVNKSESYILKLLCNNEKILKEFINYRVSGKKGLKLLIETIFTELDIFKEKDQE